MSRRVVRVLTWASIVGMLFAGITAGFSGHPWIAAGFASGIAGQIVRAVSEARSR